MLKYFLKINHTPPPLKPLSALPVDYVPLASFFVHGLEGTEVHSLRECQLQIQLIHCVRPRAEPQVTRLVVKREVAHVHGTAAVERLVWEPGHRAV